MTKRFIPTETKLFNSTFFTPNNAGLVSGKPKDYAKGYIAEIDKSVSKFKNRYSAGKDKFDEENKGAPTELSASELIKKYA